MDSIEGKCLQCGRCCMTAYLKLDSVPVDDPLGIGEWLTMHRCDVMKHEDSIGVSIPLTCKHLDFDKDTGKYKCRIYDKRLPICRQYYCKPAVDALVRELADGLNI